MDSKTWNWAGVQAATNELPTLGQVVTWHMDGLQADLPGLSQEMTSAGLDEFIPRAPTPRVALHRALEAFLREHWGSKTLNLIAGEDEEDDDDGADRTTPLIRTVNNYDREWLVFAVVAEHQLFQASSLRYQTTLRIKLHKKTGMMVCVASSEGNIEAENESQEFARLLTPYWTFYRDRLLGRDLSRVLKSIVDWASGISLRREGGMYFVPRDQCYVLDQIRDLLTSLSTQYGGTPVFLTLGVPDERETRVQMMRATYRALTREGQKLESELDTLISRGDKNRSNTLASLLAQYTIYQSKIAGYSEIMEIDIDALQQHAENLKSRVREMLVAL